MGRTLTQQQAIDELNASTKVTVGPNLIAAAMGMSPSVLRKHVRDGDYSLSTYDIQGSRIRFFRKDFLQKIGELPMDQEEPSDHQLIVMVVEALTTILKTQKAMLELIDQQNDILHAMSPGFALRFKEKTAGAATPTE